MKKKHGICFKIQQKICFFKFALKRWSSVLFPEKYRLKLKLICWYYRDYIVGIGGVFTVYTHYVYGLQSHFYRGPSKNVKKEISIKD